ncbi:MAG: transposase family protein, partial [Spirochaetales bacterium]|nr:transposase family protein [Spirochaetales bacterium]
KRIGLKYYFENGLKLTELAEALKVGESTVRSWLQRIDCDFKNIQKLKRTDTIYTIDEKCHQSQRIVDFSDDVKKMLDNLITANPTMGALKIKQYFYRHHQILLPEKRVYFYLKEKGIIENRKKINIDEKEEHKRRFEYPEPLAAVQLDLMQITLSGGEKVYLVTFIDDYSRFILKSKIIAAKTMIEVIKVLKKVIKEYGVMERVITDKGSEFVSWQSFTAFEEILCTFDIELIASGPNKPQNQGKIERWHQTLKKEIEYKRGCFTLAIEAQREIDRFVNYYNYERPHQGIGGLLPADRFYSLNEEIEKELSRYKGNRYDECIYFSCNIRGKKFVISGPRDSEIKIYQDNKEIV